MWFNGTRRPGGRGPSASSTTGWITGCAFSVDNPHTNRCAWDHVLGEIKRTDPDVLFPAEAFTRLTDDACAGRSRFHQSYTYFHLAQREVELEEYLRELSGPSSAFMRLNFSSTPRHPASLLP